MSHGEPTTDVVLVGAGIMSATLGALLSKLDPTLTIQIFEFLDRAAAESSDAWSNAGTGHSGYCELNYTPQSRDQSVDVSKAIQIAEQFEVSRQFWASLVERGELPDPRTFIRNIPHLSFVWGEANVAYLRQRHRCLLRSPLFEGLEYTEDPGQIAAWIPLVMEGEPRRDPVAATRMAIGNDVNFGSLTRGLIAQLGTQPGVEVHLGHEVLDLRRDGEWLIDVRDVHSGSTRVVRSRFVFIGAGGYSLPLLERSGIPEAKGYGAFPVSGQWLRCTRRSVIEQHDAKVYGKAELGAPPMSVPHLDTRIVDGQASLMFGPYAGFNTKFLKQGSWLDLFATIRLHNLIPMIAAGASNLGLVKYLIGQLVARKSTKFDALKEFMPTADPKDWYKITAGQRVQVIKKDADKGGVLQFGTEVITSADGSIAGLLGASPGASTAVPIMLDVLARCFPERMSEWTPTLKKLVPTYGRTLSDNPKLAAKTLGATQKVLAIS